MAAAYVELLQDAVDVVLYGAYLDNQAICDLLIGQLLPDKLENFALSGGQTGGGRNLSGFGEQLRKLADTGDQSGGNFGGNQGLALVDGPDLAQHLLD